jgi:hypothetical protein
MSEEDFFGNGNSAYLPSEVIHRFGNYKITGDLEIAGTYNTDKVKNTLYYNHTKKQFFLLKQFISGKYHIDFFLSFDQIEPGLFFDMPGIFKVKVAFSTGYDEKLLSFDYTKNVYLVQSENLGNQYTIYFQKVKN